MIGVRCLRVKDFDYLSFSPIIWRYNCFCVTLQKKRVNSYGKIFGSEGGFNFQESFWRS